MSQQPTAEGAAPRNAATDDDDELMDIIGGLEREAADDGDDDSSNSSGRDEDDGSDSNASGDGHGDKGTSAAVAGENPFHKADGNDRYLPNTCGGQLAVDLFRLVVESNNGGSNSGGGVSGVPEMKMIADKPRKEAAADDADEEEVTQHPELKSVVDMVLSKLRAPASVVLTYLISDLLVSEEDGSPTSQIRKEVAALQPYRFANKSSSTSRRSVNLLSEKRLGKAGKAVIGERWGLDAATAAAALVDESGSPVSPTSPGSDFGSRGSPTHFLLHSPTTPHSSSMAAVSKVVVPPQKEEAGLKRNDSIRLEFPTTDSIAPNHLQPSQLMSLAYCAAFCGLVFDVFVDEAGNLRRSRSVEEEEEANSKAPSTATTTTSQQQQKQDDSFDEFEKGDGPVSEGGGPRLIDAEDVMVYPLWRVLIGKRLPEVLFSLAQMQEPRGPERHKKAAASLLKGLLDQIGGEFTRSAGGSHLRVLLEVLLDLWRRCVELEYTIAIQSAVPVLPAGALRAISHTLFKGILPHLTQAWTCWPRETIISTLKRLYSTLSISICMRDTSPQTNHHHHHRPDEEHVGFLDGADMGRDVPPLTTALWRTWLTTDTHGASFASLHSSVIVRWCSRRILLVCGDEGNSAQEQQQQLALLLADVSAVDVQKQMQQHDLTEDVMHRFVGMCCAA